MVSIEGGITSGICIVMSSWLFNIYMGDVVSEVHTRMLGRGLGLGLCQVFLELLVSLGLNRWVTFPMFFSSGNILDQLFTSDHNQIFYLSR